MSRLSARSAPTRRGTQPARPVTLQRWILGWTKRRTMMTRNRHVCALTPAAVFMRKAALRMKHFRNGLGVFLTSEELSKRPFAAAGTESPCRCFTWIDQHQ